MDENGGGVVGIGPNTSSFEGKSAAQTEKPRRKTKWCEENETTGENHDHHGQTVAATTVRGGLWSPGCGFLAPLRFGVSFLFADFCLGSSVLGLLGFFCNLS